MGAEGRSSRHKVESLGVGLRSTDEWCGRFGGGDERLSRSRLLLERRLLFLPRCEDVKSGNCPASSVSSSPLKLGWSPFSRDGDREGGRDRDRVFERDGGFASGVFLLFWVGGGGSGARRSEVTAISIWLNLVLNKNVAAVITVREDVHSNSG
jgi:hypothetical protein